MDHYFAHETKALIAKSREIAIDLGYDYISTLHIFFADCEIESDFSIFKFAFKGAHEYSKFKSNYKKSDVNYLDFIDGSLPLTTEAEISIRKSFTEKNFNSQKYIYPWHILIAAIKDKETLLSECFKNDPNVSEKLSKYYEELGAFNIDRITSETPATKKGFIARLFSK
jgi:hypothetical protein